MALRTAAAVALALLMLPLLLTGTLPFLLLLASGTLPLLLLMLHRALLLPTLPRAAPPTA